LEFQSFSTFEEMMDAIEQARIIADGKVKPWQAAVKAGDFFVQDTDYGFFIFGEILQTDEEFYTTEAGRHYRFCRAFSVACSEGECGDVHVSVISGIITKELFEEIRNRGWNVDIPE